MKRCEVWFACMALALAACGGDESGEDPLDPMVDATPDPEADPDAAPDPEPDALDGGAPIDAAVDAGPPPVSRPSSCAAATTTSIGPEGGALTVGEGALVDAAVVIGARAFEASVPVTLECADDDLVGEGYVALGPAMRVGTPTPHRFGFGNWARVTWVYDAASAPPVLRNKHLRLFWRPDDEARVVEPPLVDPEIDLVAGTVAFDTPGLGVFQVGYIEDAGQPIRRRFAYRAIAGISMGAGGASYFATKHHELFDFIMPLGGAVDWVYLMDYITQRLTGGFCRHDQGGGLGAWCGVPDSGQQFEHAVSYLHFKYQDSGGSFDREEYGKLFQDLAFAYGNPLMYNPDSPYLPPGVPFEELLRPVAQRCAAECRGDGCPPPETFTIERGFYDDEYNPDGSLPVIMFCDGEDGEPYGKFDGRVPHDKPSDLVLAVDLDGNGRRDTYEPVIRNMYEPYGDVGCDSVPSSSEPGYDPVANPDPAGDDYDWYRNPLGTEGNWMYDGYEACGGDGAEPYVDAGLDGLVGTPQYAEGGYDWGEGNGRFDYNPNYERALKLNGGSMYLDLSPEERARLQVWTDGGIRDLFNFATAANHWVGRLQAGGQNVRIYDGFPRILPGGGLGPHLPNANRDDPFGELGQSVLMRYGDPWLDDETVMATNDGEHVGTTIQALNRFMTMYDWVHNRWEHLEPGPANPGYGSRTETVFFHSERFGKTFRYAITVPPGYDDPAASEERYPLVILMHGYGQRPEDLPGTGVLLSDPMIQGVWARTLIVSPDGSCGRNDRVQCNDGVDNDRDGTVDAGNDAERRVRCERTAECGGGYTCRPQTFTLDGKPGPKWCCPPESLHCGPPDARCGLRGGNRTEDVPVPICADGVDNDFDGLTDLEDEGCLGLRHLETEADCREGSFYTEHQAGKDGRPGGPDWEGALLDMIDHIDTHYRTRRPETVTVPR